MTIPQLFPTSRIITPDGGGAANLTGLGSGSDRWLLVKINGTDGLEGFDDTLAEFGTYANNSATTGGDGRKLARAITARLHKAVNALDPKPSRFTSQVAPTSVSGSSSEINMVYTLRFTVDVSGADVAAEP